MYSLHLIFDEFKFTLFNQLYSEKQLQMRGKQGLGPYHAPTPAPIPTIAPIAITGYSIVGLFCYICSFLFFLWLFSFTYALLAGLRFTCRG
jgi:hypothetical protein